MIFLVLLTFIVYTYILLVRKDVDILLSSFNVTFVGSVMSKTINSYPKWVEKYRGKGKTIRKTKYGYGLYKCTSVYDPTCKYPVSKQEFLGMIYEDKGFVAKTSKDNNAYKYMGYGLSFVITNNFNRDLKRASYDKNENIINLGILKYIYGSFNEIIVKSDYLTYQNLKLVEYIKTANNKRIDNIVKTINSSFTNKIDDTDDLNTLLSLLRLSVIDISNMIKPQINENLDTLARKYGIKLWQ